jgi:S1-C subfamily serine protease
MKRWLIVLSVVAIVVCGVDLIVPDVKVYCPVEVIQVAPYSLADRVNLVRPGVVFVLKNGACEGSGFAVAENIVLTAKHITDGTYGEYTVTADDGTTFQVRAVVEDKEHDLSYLLIDGALPVLSLGDIDDVRVGDSVFIIGSPLGLENFNSVSLGILAARQRDLSEYGEYGWNVLFQSTSPSYPGNSGSPVFDFDGRVIGVLVVGYDATLNYSVPASFIDVPAVQQMFKLAQFQTVNKPTFAVTEEMWQEQVELIDGLYGQIEQLQDQQQAIQDSIDSSTDPNVDLNDDPNCYHSGE